MDSENKKNKFKKLFWLIILVPIFILAIIIFSRKMITPSNQEVIDDLYNTRNYSCKVEYTFINSKGEYKENTTQYYSADKGMRIEFENEDGRIKVYKGSDIQIYGENGHDYIVDKNIDEIYPLASIENISNNQIDGELEVVTTEWSDKEYIKVNLDYSNGNKHLDKAEFYVDKKTKTPVLLKIFDDSGKERILVSYTDFKTSKEYDESLF